MSHPGHYREVCQYGHVHSQCRCPQSGPDHPVSCDRPDKHAPRQPLPPPDQRLRSTNAAQFHELLLLDPTIKLTYQQQVQVSQLLAFVGATPPLPVISTRAELAAAPQGIVLQDRNGLLMQKYTESIPGQSEPEHWWCAPGDEGSYDDEDVLLPARVLYQP